MNIFHTHKFKKIKEGLDFKHPLDNGKWEKCPYPGCTETVYTLMCEKCGIVIQSKYEYTG